MTPKEITKFTGLRRTPPWVMKLALDVAAAEREACAQVADRHSTCLNDNANVIAAAIRARGDK